MRSVLSGVRRLMDGLTNCLPSKHSTMAVMSPQKESGCTLLSGVLYRMRENAFLPAGTNDLLLGTRVSRKVFACSTQVLSGASCNTVLGTVPSTVQHSRSVQKFLPKSVNLPAFPN